MSRTSPSVPSLHRSRHTARIVTLLAASLLWHLFLYNWANGYVTLPSLRSDQQEVVTAELRPLPAPPVAAEKPRVSAKRKPRPRRIPPPAANAMVPADSGAAAATTTAEAAPLQPAYEEADPQPRFTEPPAAEKPSQVTYKFDPPPSAELTYDVEGLIKGAQWYGNGVYRWETDGQAYSVTGEAWVTMLFRITVLNFRSEGDIAGFGLAPVLYREKPFRKSETNTHFQHENGKISFSASEAVFPYQGGEQDRASIMWQLAGIGRGDASQLAPGTAFDVTVAGVRNADPWRLTVVGQEEVDTPDGRMQAWHVTRVPKADSHEQKIDFWLAPQLEWYPVRLRFTYANGEYFELKLSKLSRPAAADTTAPKQ